MCGSLRWNHGEYKKQDSVHVEMHGVEKEVKWASGGFARAESAFWKNKAVPVTVLVEEFTEGNKSARHKVEGELRGLVAKDDVEAYGKILAKKNEVVILTRPALTRYEKNIHSRWPIVMKNVDGEPFIQVWTKEEK